MNRHLSQDSIDIQVLHESNHSPDDEEWDRNGKWKESHVPSSEEEEHHKNRIRETSIPEQHAIEEYKDGSSRFNRPLRTGVKSGKETQELTGHLMNVTKHPLPNDSHGFRAFQKVNMSKLKVGDTIHDKGFTGVSRDYETARGYASEKDGNRDENEDAVHHYVARVHIPKGTKGLYADQVDHLMTREKETILHPGTSFKVTGKSVSHEEKDGKDHFHHIIHMTAKSSE